MVLLFCLSASDTLTSIVFASCETKGHFWPVFFIPPCIKLWSGAWQQDNSQECSLAEATFLKLILYRQALSLSTKQQNSFTLELKFVYIKKWRTKQTHLKFSCSGALDHTSCHGTVDVQMSILSEHFKDFLSMLAWKSRFKIHSWSWKQQLTKNHQLKVHLCPGAVDHITWSSTAENYLYQGLFFTFFTFSCYSVCHINIKVSH